MPEKLVVLSGPSAVGKDTVINAWHDADPSVERVIAYVTRAPRGGETDGVDYHFVSEEQFKKMAEEKKFLEYAEVHGNYYATPNDHLERIEAAGGIAVLKIDVQGALRVMKLRPEAVTIFLLPPNEATLRSRIHSRGEDSVDIIERRLAAARWEMGHADRYQHQIINEDVDKVVRRLQDLTRK